MKKGIFILLAISLATSVYILASSDTDSLYRKVQGFGIGLPQEKVYLISTIPATSWAIRFGTKDTSHEATKEH